MINRDLKKVLEYLGSLLLVVVLFWLIALLFPHIIHYCQYRFQTADLDEAQSLKIYFDDQFIRDVPAEDIALYVREIRKSGKFNWGSACPFTIKLVFSFSDKPAYDVLIGTDGCKQLRLPSGMQSKFPYVGKLTELEKEYMALPALSAEND